MEEYEGEYRSNIQPRESGFTRSMQRSSQRSYGSPSSGGRVLKIVTEMGSNSVTGLSPALSANAASAILESREREKKEMQDLNDRLASYIEKVRFLEAQNRKLAADLEALRGRWGKDTSTIKVEYSSELSSARKSIDEAAKKKAEVEVQIARLQEDIADFKRKYDEALALRRSDKEKIDGYTTQLGDCENEIAMLRRRLQTLEEEMNKFKDDNEKVEGELRKAKLDLDQETLARIDFQNQVQTLMEEIEFLRRVHDQEVKELETLASRDSPADNREYFKNELALAIRDIRNEYDAIAQQSKQDMESWYKLKVQEVQSASQRQNMETNYQREETKRLRNNLGDLRGKLADLESKNAMLEKQVQELTYQLSDDQRQYESALNDRDAQLRKMREEAQALMAELQMLLDTKQTLDAEIAIYRKMLEGEESRQGLKQMVEQVVKTHSLQQQEDTETNRQVKGEVSTRTSFQRSAKGNMIIAEADPNGKFIVLENQHKNKEENIGDWKLKRKIDGKREVVFTFPGDFAVKPGRSVKIWARGQGGKQNPPFELIFEGDESWGTGNNVQTLLMNKDGEERATHNQKTMQVGQ